MIKFTSYDEAILTGKTSKFNEGDFREVIVTFFGAL